MILKDTVLADGFDLSSVVDAKIYPFLKLKVTLQDFGKFTPAQIKKLQVLFDPVPEGAVAKYIMGGQGNLWTEAIPTLSYAFYMAYPRAFALSETFWSPKENKIWENFIYKTEDHFKRFDVTNYNISKAVLDPIVTVFKDGDKLMCKLTNSVPETEIFYTIDNTYPVKFGEKYSEPFEIPQGNLELRTQTFRNNIPIGRELLIKRSELEKRVKN